MDIVEFLLDRIAEDEQLARSVPLDAYQREVGSVALEHAGDSSTSAVHHALRWDPARVLAECDAKRSIIREARRVLTGFPDVSDRRMDSERSWAQFVLCTLAQPYADHPDFEDHWRPLL